MRILRGGKDGKIWGGGRGGRGGRDGKGRKGGEEENEEREYDGVREWLDGLEGGDGDLEMGEGYDRGKVERKREGEGGSETSGEHDRDLKTNYPYRNATSKGTAERDKHGEGDVQGAAPVQESYALDADGDVDMLSGETLEVQQPVYWPGDEDTERPEKKETKEREEEEVLEGMADGPF